ncbi:MAG: penicillin-binding protein 1A [Bdellovibrio sp.]|nr:MAG: penicillin-binding protein 1A [Bdellovibrio sp.]
MIKKLVLASLLLIVIAVGGVYYAIYKIKSELPNMITLEDYKPLLLSQVYDRAGRKIGEFSRERRVLVPYEKLPKHLINAFVAAEDDQFFQHGGVNYLAILRATIANFRAGKNVQGGSTITQQVAKTLLLTSEKTMLRKIRELFLAHQMEENLDKEDILYLYLNQIYFGNSAFGISVAAETYFRKPVENVSLSEAAMLAGLPKAPSEYSPVVNPTRAKERQVYVLNRMADVGFITREQARQAIAEPVTVFLRENYDEVAPYFTETVRQLLVPRIGEEKLLEEGVSIYTSLDIERQKAAQAAVERGLKQLDKRQGYRGAISNITDPKAVGDFLLKTRNKMMEQANPSRVIQPNGKFADYSPFDVNYDLRKGLPFYLKIGKSYDAIVNRVDDEDGLVYVRLAEIEGLIDAKTMSWARKPNPEKRYDQDTIKKPSAALRVGDVISVKLVDTKVDPALLGHEEPGKKAAKKKMPLLRPGLNDPEKYAQVELDQEPLVEAGLLSFDQGNGEVIAMVGGYDYKRDKFNKALQAARQTGSAFKSIVYAAALDKGFTPSTPILDAPLVYDEGKAPKEESAESAEGGEDEVKRWKPSNHERNYAGDIIFRNALVRSLNIPTVKITEDIGVNWVADFARRLGVFSPLNMDFTLGLGSSSLTLYELTKVFAQIGRLGHRVRPIIVQKIVDREGKEILGQISLDDKFEKQLSELNKQYEERRNKYLEEVKAGKQIDPLKSTDPHFFFADPEQLITPQTAYLITSLLKAVVEDRDGTGGQARALGREVAAKTGTTNGYYDAWFIGFTQQIVSGVWVGFNHEKSLGKAEVGGRAALPIWLEYMKAAHENLPIMTLPVPEGIVFANIDGDTGFLASTSSKHVIRGQAFREGTVPATGRAQKEEENDFYKQDSSE